MFGRKVWSGVCADSWWIFKQHRDGTGNHSRRASEELSRSWAELMVRNGKQVDGEIAGGGIRDK